MLCKDGMLARKYTTAGEIWPILPCACLEHVRTDEDRLRPGKIFKLGFGSTFVQIGPDASHTEFPTSHTEFRASQSGVTATIAGVSMSPAMVGMCFLMYNRVL